MIKPEYEKALASVQAEIVDLVAERSRIDSRLSELKNAAASLSGLLRTNPRPNPDLITQLVNLTEISNEVTPDAGITSAVRRVLRKSGIPTSAVDIKSAIEDLGEPDLSKYVNASAVIHNTLTRLERQGEVARVVDTADQKVFYVLARHAMELEAKLANLQDFIRPGRNRNK